MPEAAATEPQTSTILVVDDEESILTLAEMTLEEEGYEVLTASSGDLALRISEEHPDDIDVFVIDVVMPRMSGPDLAERLAERRPEARVIFTSGYGDAAGVALRQRSTSAVYLRKPFGPDELCQVVDRLLGS